MSRTRQQTVAIDALIRHDGDVATAAAAIGVHAKTLAMWMQHPDFATAWRQALSMHFEKCLAQLQIASSEAVGTLKAIMRDGSGRGSMARMRACVEILELAQLGEKRDVLRRLERVECTLGIGKPAGGPVRRAG